MRFSVLIRLLTAAVVACFLAAMPIGAATAGTPSSAKDIAAAKKHMAAGVAYMQDPDGPKYEEAYPEFKKAYDFSGSLNALQNLAICSQNLELDGEAIEHYEKFLEGKGSKIEPSVKKQVERDIQALKAVVAWVTLSADKVGATITDVRFPRRGSPVTNEYPASIQGKEHGIHPGKHKITARLDGFKDKVWEVQIKNGSEHSHTFAFDEDGPVTAEGFTEADQKGLGGDGGDEAGDGGTPVAPFVVGGVTVAVAVTWAVFMGLSASQKSEYDDAVGTAPLTEQEDLKSDLETTNLVADVMLGVTAAGAVATIILFATADWGNDGEEDSATDPAKGPKFGVDYTLVPMVDPRGGAAAVLTARF